MPGSGIVAGLSPFACADACKPGIGGATRQLFRVLVLTAVAIGILAFPLGAGGV